MSVSGSLAEGGRREQLEALRARLAEKIDDPGVSGAELASLSRQFVLVTAELEELTEPDGVDGLDELRRRRAERLSGTDAARGPAEERKRRRGGG